MAFVPLGVNCKGVLTGTFFVSFIAILHRVLFKKVVLQRATKQKNAYICDVMWPKNPQDGHIESVFLQS